MVIHFLKVFFSINSSFNFVFNTLLKISKEENDLMFFVFLNINLINVMFNFLSYSKKIKVFFSQCMYKYNCSDFKHRSR